MKLKLPPRPVSRQYEEISKKAACILKLPTDHKVLQGIRRSGKTSMCIRLAANRALRGNHSIVVCAPNMEQLSVLRSKIAFCIAHLEDIPVNTPSLIKLHNGSVIRFFVLNRVLYPIGSIDLVIVDNAADCHNEGLADILNRTPNSFIAATLPFNVKNNEFWKRWKAARKVRHGCYQLDLKDCKHLTKEMIESYRRMTPEHVFHREFRIRLR